MPTFWDSLSITPLGLSIPFGTILVSTFLFKIWNSRNFQIPSYGSPFLPPFVNGLLAAVRLGADEDAFLLGLKETSGPIVYIPWPLAQYFILTSKTINSFYATPQTQLSFIPFRLSMQDIVFGYTGGHHPFLLDKFYPANSRGLSKPRLQIPISRFNETFGSKVDNLRSKVVQQPNDVGHIDIPIVRWLLDTMWDAGLGSLFGLEFVEKSRPHLQHSHDMFDSVFAILASDMVPRSLRSHIKLLRDGLMGRDEAHIALCKFLEADLHELEEGLIFDLVQLARKEGVDTAQLARLILCDMWALQANAPYACIALFIRVFQSPGLVERLRAEIEQGDILLESGQINYQNLNDEMPLMTSCIYETLRLETSAFSIRIAKEDFAVCISDQDTHPKHAIVPQGSKIIAATRVPHLTDDVWGDKPDYWDPERFLVVDDDNMDVKNRQVKMAKLLKDFRGFGGGVSMCEGRHLAVMELKTALTNFIMNFDMVPLVKPNCENDYTRIKFKDSPDGHFFAPKKLGSRPGLGAFQFAGDMNVRVSLRK